MNQRVIPIACLAASCFPHPAFASVPPKQDVAGGAGSTLRAPWTERRVDHGIVSTASLRLLADCDSDRADRLVRRVVRTRGLAGDLFGHLVLRRPDTPVLLLFESPEDMVFTVRTSLAVSEPTLPAEAVLRSNGPTLAACTGFASILGLERALQAEAFKQFMMPRCPEGIAPWAMHGLAEYFGAILFDGDRLDPGLAPPDLCLSVQKALGNDRLVPINRLAQLDQEGWAHFEKVHGPMAMRAQAWSLVHFMLHGGPGELRERFLRWFEQTCSGNDPFGSFEATILGGSRGSSFEVLEGFWRSSIGGLEPSPVHVAVEMAELLATCLETMESEGVRPSDLGAMESLIRDLPEIELETRSGPCTRVLSSHDVGWLDIARLRFEAGPVRAPGSAGAPPAIWITMPGDWEIGVTWTRRVSDGAWRSTVVRRRAS